MCCRWNIQIEMKKTLIGSILGVEHGTPRFFEGSLWTTHIKCEPTPRGERSNLCSATRPPELIPMSACRINRSPVSSGPLGHRFERCVERPAEVR